MQQPEIRMYDLYSIWYKPFWHQPWFLYSVIVVGATLMILFLAYMFWRWKNRRMVLSIWDATLQEFDALHPEHYQAQEADAFYVRLCAIFKNYLIRRYQIDLTDKSDQEIINFFHRYGLPEELREHIDQVLQGAITIKFANQAAAREQMMRDLQTCRGFVQHTRVQQEQISQGDTAAG